jgi:hypothetical protein
MERVPRCLALLADRRLRIPPVNHEKVVEAGPVLLSVQIGLQVGDIPSTPHKGAGEDQQGKVGEMIPEMIPMKMPLQGCKTLSRVGGTRMIMMQNIGQCS